MFAGIMMVIPLFKILSDKTGDTGNNEYSVSSLDIAELQQLEFAVPAVTALVVIPLSCSVSTGIFAGIASYILSMLVTGNSDRLRASMWIIALLYVFTLVFTN